MLAIRDGGAARLFTRNCYDIGQRHKHITKRLTELLAERFVLEGELVVRDAAANEPPEVIASKPKARGLTAS